ncbi:MAG: hypothetical protein WDO12_07990 [Pseudomonadota bacterium]
MRGTLVAALGLLAGCGVRMQPDYEMPQPMMKPMAAKVGLLIDEPLRKYTHEETRAGGNWKINLGPGHDHLFRSMFGASFQPLQVFTDIDAARAAGMQVIFEPGIEQYSFVTANETASGYWAVTLRYRIVVLDPTGNAVDSFSLTGYGSAYGERGAESSLTAATRSAMRDAAAKFLVQMPRQALSQKLLAGQSVSAADKAAAADVVETVPIDPVPAT